MAAPVLHPALMHLTAAVENNLDADVLNLYKDRFAELQRVIEYTRQRDADAATRSNHLRRAYRDESIALETARIRRTELLEVSDAADAGRKKAAAALGELETQLSGAQLEMNELTLRENELTDDVNQLKKDNTAVVGPALADLARSIVDTKEELSRATSAVSALEENKAELRKRMEKLTNDTKSLQHSVGALRAEESKVGSEPNRLAKQVESVEHAISMVRSEHDRLEDAVKARIGDLAAQHSAIHEVAETRANLEKKLSRHRADIEAKDQETIALERTLRSEKAQHKQLLERRLEVQSNEESARTTARLAQTELDAANAAYERAKRELKNKTERLGESVANLGPAQSMLSEKELEMRGVREEFRRLDEQSQSLRHEMDIMIAGYLKEEGVEKKHRMALAEVAAACAALEREKEQWHNEEILAYKQIAALKVQRDMKSREVEKTISARKSTIETSRMKELSLSDLSKQLADVNSRLKQFAQLYDVVKGERNSFATAIQSASQSSAEMRERLKILKNEVDILQNESSAKDKALAKEQHAHTTSSAQRDVLRASVNRSARDYSERQYLVEQQILSIDKLSSVIDGLERDMNGLKMQYEAAVEMRNYTGIQLIDRNDELCVLYEKSNVHEKTLSEGERSLQGMAEETRSLHISVQEIDRQLHVARLRLPDTPMWAERILELQSALVAARQVTQKLSGQLETPSTTKRWIALDGEDPDSEQIQLRVAELEERLNLARADLLERDLVLEELRGLSDRLQGELHGNGSGSAAAGAGGGDAGSAAASTLAKQVNDLQSKIRDSTRKLMALVSELSMYQATAIKLSSETSAGEQMLHQAEENLSRGLAPSLAAEQRWASLERQLMGGGGGRGGAFASTAGGGEGDFDGFGGGRTAAEPRPNAYIPVESSGPGLPKPYGHFAPFKPTEPGATMRHYRNPEPKPIEI